MKTLSYSANKTYCKNSSISSQGRRHSKINSVMGKDIPTIPKSPIPSTVRSDEALVFRETRKIVVIMEYLVS